MRTSLLSRPARWAVLSAFTILIAATACKKRTGDDGPGGSPEAASTDLFLFANIRVQDLMKSTLVEELKKNRFPVGDKMMSWEEMEQMAAAEIGVKPSRIESFTIAMTDFPGDKGSAAPRAIGILVSQDDFNQDALKKKLAKGGPSNRAGYSLLEPGFLLHFPDARTMVFVSEDLVGQYEQGFAKYRDGWPFNGSLRRASGDHSIFVSVNLDKLPPNARRDAPAPELQNLVAAKSATVGIDLKNKGLGITLRGEYPDDNAARAAGDSLNGLLRMALAKIDGATSAPDVRQDPAVANLMRNFRDSLAGVRPEVSGKTVTASANIQADSLLTGLMLPAVQKVREAASRTQSMNNLKQIGLALHISNDQMGFLPTGGLGEKGMLIRDAKGKPLLSWRVAILPFIEQSALYNEFKLDEPWDSPHNKKLIEKMPKIYASPNSTKAKPGETHYQMVFGPRVLRPGMTIQTIVDGSSNTIAVVEAADPVIWTKPGDISIPGDKPPSDLLNKFGGLYPAGFNALFFDGSVRFIATRGLTARQLWAALTPDGGETEFLP